MGVGGLIGRWNQVGEEGSIGFSIPSIVEFINKPSISVSCNLMGWNMKNADGNVSKNMTEMYTMEY